MIEIFRTNVTNECDAVEISKKLQAAFPGISVTFDLQDCDHIMRVSAPTQLPAMAIVATLSTFGFTVSVLPDEIHVIDYLDTLHT